MRQVYVLKSEESEHTHLRGAWGSGIEILKGDVYENDSGSYECYVPHLSASGNEPGVGGSWTTYWCIYCQGQTGDIGASGAVGLPGQNLTFKGVYNPSTSYVATDFVSYSHLGFVRAYYNIVPCQGIAPTDVDHWVPMGVGEDGWSPATETWLYNTANDPMYTVAILGDYRTKYQAGQKVKLTQTTVKYFIITYVVLVGQYTVVYLYGGTDYDLANAAISAPHFSPMASPFGFPMDPAKWTITVTDTSIRDQATPTVEQWYNIQSLSIELPAGIWDLSYSVMVYGVDSVAAVKQMRATLSTSSSTESDVDFCAACMTGGMSAFAMLFQRSKCVAPTVTTTYYLLERTDYALDHLYIANNMSKLIIKAVCSYFR